MNTKIIISIAIIGAVAASAIGGTVAYFSDSEISRDNAFIAGALDLKVNHTFASYNGNECGEACVTDAGIDLVNNGDFEQPVVANSAKWYIFPSVAGGWNVEWRADVPATFGGLNRPDPANLELHRQVLGPAYSGEQYAELDTDWYGPSSSQTGEPASVKIYQDLATVAGQNYQISFAFSPRPNTSAADNVLEVKWGGSVVDTINAAGGGANNWTVYTYQVSAAAVSTRLEFTDLGTGNSSGTFLDDVIVNPVDCNYQMIGGTCRLWEEKDLQTGDIFYDFGDVKPGDFGTNVISLHVHDNDSWACIKTADIVDLDNTVVDPELDAGDSATSTVGELSEFIKVFAWEDDNNGIFDPGETQLLPANTPLADELIGKIGLLASQVDYVGIAWCFGEQSLNGNTIVCDGSSAVNPNINISQTDSTTVSLSFYAVQQRHNEDFECTDPDVFPAAP
jgi:predicted ribosomally synthesized peptide with SipW-like signal peptide